MMRTRLAIFLPVLLAITLASGIALGYFISIENYTKEGTQSQINKIGYIIRLLEANYVDAIDVQHIAEDAIDDLTLNLDPHTVYVPAADKTMSDAALEAGFVGVGIYFTKLGDTLLVEHPIYGGPARNAGLRCGDRIIAVDGHSFVGFTFKEAFQKLRGQSGSTVRLSVKRQETKGILTFEVTRAEVASPSVDYGYMINDSTGYIKITKFGARTFSQFTSELTKMIPKGMKGLILDLRDNGGGYLGDATKLADEFLSSPDLIVYTNGKNKKYDEVFKASDKGRFLVGNVAVLINENSASASEIVSGALQDNDRAVLIGRRTYGKGLVQRPYALNDGSSMRITISRYYTPSGRCIQKPYTSLSSYKHDYFDRVSSGELFLKDSVKVIDSLKFTTKKGRVVYGGGGIIPDVFIGADSSKFTDFYAALTKKKITLQLAVDYMAHHAKAAKVKFPARFNEKLLMLCKAHGIKIPQASQIDFEMLRNEIEAYVMREWEGLSGYYRVQHTYDPFIEKALHLDDSVISQ